MKRIILASASPRRAELLRQIGVPFEVMISDAEEELLDLPPDEFAKSTAFQKARIISKNVDEGIIIAADTIVAIDDKILGKPSNTEDAFNMLSMLSGKKHEVYTGLCIIEMPSGYYFLNYEKTDVFFRELSESEINAYIKTGESFDKAGSYGAQGLGSLLIEKIHGCYFNVVGLPIAMLNQALKQFNINLLGEGEAPQNGVLSD